MELDDGSHGLAGTALHGTQIRLADVQAAMRDELMSVLAVMAFALVL